MNNTEIEKTGPGLDVCALASGSKGNAIYVSDGATAILVDAGLSGRELERRMRAKGLEPEKLSAVLVTHEHSDHIRGAGVLSRRYKIPVYITAKTARAIDSRLGKPHETVYFDIGSKFSVGELNVHPFSTSHDACDPAGFTVERGGRKVGVATDLGIATSMVRHHLKDCGLLVLEANHDPRMLIEGPYPWPLKQRIRGRTGHLSNTESRDLIGELVNGGLSQVVLAHLSETNNTPEKALREVTPAMNGSKTRLAVALQDHGSDVFKL